MRFRALDGLRAAAILLLVIGHAADGWPLLPLVGAVSLPVGYAVVMLLVFAGFAVTNGLLEEFDRTGGIALRLFYSRKSVRLFPTLLVFGAVTSIHQWFDGIDVHWTRIPAVLGLVGNYYNGLAIEDEHRHSVGHLWSIAVSAQFLVVWSGVLWWGLRSGRERLLAPGLAAVALLAAGLRTTLAYLTGVSDLYIYNATETRIDAIAIGALLAVSRHDPAVRLRVQAFLSTRLLPWIAGATIALSVTGEPAYRLGPGLTVEAICTAVLLGALLDRSNAGGWMLTAAPLRAVGVVSFSLFVWHLYGIEIGRRLAPENEVAALVIALITASLPYLVLERPFRPFADRLRPAAFAE